MALAVVACGSNPPSHYVIPDTTTAAQPVTEAQASAPLADPTQLIIDKIGVNTSLAPTGLEKDGSIHVPDLNHVDQAFWLCAQHTVDAGKPVCKIGAVPGAVGPAVAVAHVDGKGKPGAFININKLVKGDDIQVRRADGSTLHFRVSSTQLIAKDAFPTKAVYGNVDHPVLRLLTCGGTFVGGQLGYKDQVIVTADLVV